MMKRRFSTRALLAAGVFWMLALGAFAQEAANPAERLSAYEQRFFSQSFPQQSMAERLNRLESAVFGETSPSLSASERESRLLHALAPLRQSPATPEPARPAGDDNLPASTPPPRMPDATDYPSVTAIERAAFGRDFAGDDLASRLSRLERKTFGRPSESGSLSDRVDRLMARYPSATPSKPAWEETFAGNASPAPASSLDRLPARSNQLSAGTDAYATVQQLEQRYLGAVQPNELLSERLDRLEKRLYGNTYTGQSVDTRISRLRHDFDMASRPSLQPRQPVARQNVQIGAGFSERSTQRFSPELINLLPPDVRTQMQTVPLQSSGTVITRETVSESGFQTFANQPLSYQNYANGQPQGAFTADPAMLQGLAMLESSLFGRIDTQESLENRLGKLETALSGQAYPTYPPDVRYANLQKAYRYRQYQIFNRVFSGNRQGNPPLLGVPLQTSPPQGISPLGVPTGR